MRIVSTPQQYLEKIQEHRSSEGNFETLCTLLNEAVHAAQQESNTALAHELQEVDEKYVAAYKKARETSGSAWPEFEKFVAQFERALTEAKKESA